MTDPGRLNRRCCMLPGGGSGSTAPRCMCCFYKKQRSLASGWKLGECRILLLWLVMGLEPGLRSSFELHPSPGIGLLPMVYQMGLSSNVLEVHINGPFI